jgi:hypothetical protein
MCDQNREIIFKGSKNASKRKKPKQFFQNQLTLISGKANVKLFQNGKVLIVGVVSTEQALTIIARLREILSSFTVVKDEPPKLRVCMINSNMKLGMKVDLHKLYERFKTKQDQIFAVYDPCIYSAVKISYFHNPTRPGGSCMCDVECRGKGPDAGDGPCKKVFLFKGIDRKNIENKC